MLDCLWFDFSQITAAAREDGYRLNAEDDLRAYLKKKWKEFPSAVCVRSQARIIDTAVSLRLSLLFAFWLFHFPLFTVRLVCVDSVVIHDAAEGGGENCGRSGPSDHPTGANRGATFDHTRTRTYTLVQGVCVCGFCLFCLFVLF